MNEIDLRGLPKKVTKILTDTAIKFIDAFTINRGHPPEEIHLAGNHWDALEAALKAKKRTIKDCTFKGIPLKRATS
jgi:hypothetical protein